MKVLESSLLQQYPKIRQGTLFKVSFKVFHFSFDIFISMYRMNLISLTINKAMLGHRFKYQVRCVPRIFCGFETIWIQSFDSQPFQMRFSRILQSAFLSFFWTFLLLLWYFYLYASYHLYDPVSLPMNKHILRQSFKEHQSQILVTLVTQRLLKWKCRVKIAWKENLEDSSKLRFSFETVASRNFEFRLLQIHEKCSERRVLGI